MDTIQLLMELEQNQNASLDSIETMGMQEIIESIGSYKEFFAKLKDPDHKLPLDILNQNKLEIAKWNNIPLPVVHACNMFELSFKNITRVFQTMMQDHTYRFDLIMKSLEK